MKKKRKIRETTLFNMIMLMLTLAIGASSWVRARSIGKLSYLEHLDDTIVTVDGTDYKCRNLAFYLAYQEMTTEEQARVYDLEQTDKYWNAHANGSFLRLEAKDQAMDMAIHDIIFYEMAQKESVSLTSEELAYVENMRMDFWSDLEEEGRERLGVSEDEISEVFLRMGLAQKHQKELAQREGVDYREYYVNGSAYQKLLEEHTYEIKEKLWKRLNFGKIILD